ncbi:MAG: endonuclease VIII, partial [Syntrophomonadaceae bacterium]
KAGRARLLFGDGVNLRFHPKGGKRPARHQLLIDFGDGSALSASVQMYGGLWCFPDGEFDNPYYLAAVWKPSPLEIGFDRSYFLTLLDGPESDKLSAKAWLATGQRIPGLGNGVLQDILYNARIHPKRKIGSLTGDEKEALFEAVKDTLAEMVAQGGRDTEKDLLGQAGGYKTKASKLTVGGTCPVCKGTIRKETYLGGSIYYCDGCQKI